MQPAPLYNDLADGPQGGAGYWLTASDRVRLRIGVWKEGQHGTVLLFPGRTEYIEKYGRAARDLRDRGFATLAVDWRGQGIADRLLPRPMVGHVGRFADYQKDVAEVVKAARQLDLPEPFYLIGHSMGGCIGLRALQDGLPVAAACFSGPMWDIQFNTAVRGLALSLSLFATFAQQGHRHIPGTTGDDIYVLKEPFENNLLTHDITMWDYMQTHAQTRPELLIGGPSMRWLHQALKECAALARLPAPSTPSLTFVGDKEEIVSKNAIEKQVARWPNGSLVWLSECRHEAMMETADVQTEFFDGAAAFFRANATT